MTEQQRLDRDYPDAYACATGRCPPGHCSSNPRPAESGTRTELERPFLWWSRSCGKPECQVARCVRARAVELALPVPSYLAPDGWGSAADTSPRIPPAFTNQPSSGVTWLTIAVFAALLAGVFVEVWFRVMTAVTR